MFALLTVAYCLLTRLRASLPLPLDSAEQISHTRLGSTVAPLIFSFLGDRGRSAYLLFNMEDEYGYMEEEEEWDREGLLDPAWEKQQKKVSVVSLSAAINISCTCSEENLAGYSNFKSFLCK